MYTNHAHGYPGPVPGTVYDTVHVLSGEINLVYWLGTFGGTRLPGMYSTVRYPARYGTQKYTNPYTNTVCPPSTVLVQRPEIKSETVKPNTELSSTFVYVVSQ